MITIESRLLSLSSLEKAFNDSVTPYQDALDELGYKYKLNYQTNINTSSNNKKQKKHHLVQPTIQQKSKNQDRKIFLSLIKKHFSPDHKLFKLFNENTVKLVIAVSEISKTP